MNEIDLVRRLAIVSRRFAAAVPVPPAARLDSDA